MEGPIDNYLESAREAKTMGEWERAVYFYSLAAEYNPPIMPDILIDRGFAYF